MKMKISKFPLSHFPELVPLLLRCFPEFWQPRLERGQFSFPYELTLFTGRIGDRLAACAGIHEYQLILDGRVAILGGLCDVAVDPDFRGQGLAHQLQDYVLTFCRRKTRYCAMPLYTGKPGVYLSRGWQLYESAGTAEITAAAFPPGKTFSLAEAALDMKKIWRTPDAGLRPEEKTGCEITRIYMDGKLFQGKCLRNGKIWNELFADPLNRWRLENNTYFLYHGERLLEAYSREEFHPAGKFLPALGGLDDNKVMINILDACAAEQTGLAAAIAKRELVFPAADVF